MLDNYIKFQSCLSRTKLTRLITGQSRHRNSHQTQSETYPSSAVLLLPHRLHLPRHPAVPSLLQHHLGTLRSGSWDYSPGIRCHRLPLCIGQVRVAQIVHPRRQLLGLLGDCFGGVGRHDECLLSSPSLLLWLLHHCLHHHGRLLFRHRNVPAAVQVCRWRNCQIILTKICLVAMMALSIDLVGKMILFQ